MIYYFVIRMFITSYEDWETKKKKESKISQSTLLHFPYIKQKSEFTLY